MRNLSEKDFVLEMVGREAVSETVYDEKRQYFQTRTSTPYVEETNWHIGFVTECYHGGRNEQLWFGPSYEADWSDYDLTGAYPTAMATIGKPRWREVKVVTLLKEFLAYEFGFACVEFKAPPNTRYPVFPVRTQNGIVFPLSGRSHCGTPEIALAQRLGYEIRILHAVVIPQDPDNKVFFEFIRDAIAKRNAATDDLDRAFWKEVANSCYGKTAQGLRDKRVFTLRQKRSERVQESKITNPYYAAYITSFVRAVVAEIMNAIPSNKMVFSVTTDGFLTDVTEAEMTAAMTGPLCQLYGQTRQALTGKSEVLSEKHAVGRLVGWRTRGQATLIPGQAKDEKSIVLAKAGIKSPVEATELEEQNDHIVETFFARTPKMAIELDVFTSVREMILHDADLVTKKLSRRVSMEYDFKRKPYGIAIAACRDPVSSKRSIEHLAFSTTPWRDVEEFRLVRKFWDDYWAKSPRCLKSVEDYEEFARFFDMMKSLKPRDQTYIRKSKGDLKRLQRDLCRAFKHGEAGLAACAGLSAGEFSKALNGSGLEEGGVKTKVSDVENGKRAPFAPNATPSTPAVRKVLAALALTLPEIKPHAILAAVNPDDIHLLNALNTQCPFAGKASTREVPGAVIVSASVDLV